MRCFGDASVVGMNKVASAYLRSFSLVCGFSVSAAADSAGDDERAVITLESDCSK